MARYQLTQRHIQDACKHLGQRSPQVLRALEEYGVPPSRRAPATFHTLARALAGQQLSTKAAATIFKRLCDHCGEDLPPKKVSQTRVATLRKLGLSERKAESLRLLAKEVASGRCPVSAFGTMSNDEVISEITRLKGFGVWSAQMFLMFSLGRPDVWPIDDLGVQEGFRHVFGLGERPSPKELLAAGEPFAPWRSTLALLCWHVVHQSR